MPEVNIHIPYQYVEGMDMFKPQENASPPLKRFLHLIISALWGIALTVIVIVIASFAVASGIVGDNVVFPVGILAVATGAILAGFVGAKSMEIGALWGGLVSGITCLVMLILLGSILFGRLMPGSSLLWVAASSILGGAVGGFFAANKK